MSAAIVIGILIAAGEGQAPGTAALVAALTDAVGPGPSILVEGAPSLTNDQAALMGKQWHAAAVVVVEQQPVPSDVAVRVLIVPDDRWIVRRLRFLPHDTAVERGRAAGLTIASILLAERTVFSVATEQRAGLASPAAGRPDSQTPAARAGAAAESGRAGRYAFDLNALGSMGVSGSAGGLGVASHFEFALTEGVWPRLGGGVRAGAVPGLDGVDLVYWMTAGVAWRPIRAREVGQWGLATCWDAGVVFHDLSHQRPDGTSAHAVRVLPQTSITIQGSWRAAGRWEGLAALGTEVAFGSSDVWVSARQVGTIPWVRALATVGVRFGW